MGGDIAAMAMNTQKKRSILTTAASVLGILLAVAGLVAMTVNGYLDVQVRATAPGSPATGYLRWWNDNASGPIHCVTSTGAACFFDAASPVRGIGMSMGAETAGALSSGLVAYNIPPMGCTISRWDAKLGPSGTMTMTILKNGGSICASACPSISSGTTANSSTLTGWTTSISAHDVIGFSLSAVATAETVSVTLTCQ